MEKEKEGKERERERGTHTQWDKYIEREDREGEG